MKEVRAGPVRLRTDWTDKGWYIILGRFAVCSYHAPPHLHRHADPKHPDHVPKVWVDPALTVPEAIARIRAWVDVNPRPPSFEELVEVLR